MARFLRFNSLSLFFLFIFLAAIVAQSIVGLHAYNEEAVQHAQETISWSRYVYTSEFGAAVLENWQSEWLQFCLFTLMTVWLLQEGSPESKPLDQAGLESDEQQKVGPGADSRSPLWARVGGLRTRIYENSLLIAFTVIFFGSWLAQALTGWTEYNNEQEEHRDTPISLATYLTRPDFWEKTLQNWQSEFLAVGTMAVLAIYLRQRGSPESKPVGARHDETGSTG
ncbi:MAG: hypothetical protein M3265_05885 [Actinomycetota bacterium]|nr:hypothetical protein [Actinomycetota bacterium]